MREVYVIGIGHTPFGKFLERNVKSLVSEAVTAALADTQIEKKDLEVVFFGNAMQGLVTRQEMVRGQVALRPMGIDRIPIVNCENACATGSTAFHLAWQYVSGGHAEVALAVGAEKLFMENTQKMFENYDVGMDMEIVEDLRRQWRQDAKKFGGQDNGENMPRSFAMDLYADLCRAHMKAFGTTQRDLALIASKNHNHSVHNPHAQYRKPMTVEDVLAGRPVVFPLTAPMCAPVGDGGTAAVLCSGDFLKRLRNPRPVKIRASILGSGVDRPEGFGPDHISCRLSKQAYETAGVGPEDIDVVELHDATSMGEIVQFEGLGFCAWGEAAAAARSGATALGGKIPVNPSGGLVSKGHPLGATGIGQVAEIVMQLRGEAGKRQVAGARLGLTENGGGAVGVEEASMTIHIFERMR
ncbi:MAG: thiolase family protein [Deltaproteobacteria bacterium]|nr:MAG: thiolase family protein [Deltaproteobacteria bacterium]